MSHPDGGNTDAQLIRLLCQGVTHTTSFDNYLAILEDGFIRPNEGNFPNTFPQSANSCCRHMESISVFDFNSVTDEQLESDGVRTNWSKFFHAYRPTVCFQFDKYAFENDLIRYKDTKALGPYPFVWPVEVCYRGVLSLDHVKQVFLTAWYKRWHIRVCDNFPDRREEEEFRDSVVTT